MSALIFITGYSGVGKDTFAEKLAQGETSFSLTQNYRYLPLIELCSTKECEIFHLAAGVKKIAAGIAEHTLIPYTEETKNFGGRKLLVGLTREIQELDADFFCRILHKKIKDDRARGINKTYIIPDWRYIEHYDYFVRKTYAVFTVRLTRENIHPKNGTDRYLDKFVVNYDIKL